ncbi:hypothetical protein BJ684DRAFT_17353 [Piptocephalis cylindrospora]|uniref:Uncharacterized protein n=1 Tax=Piptocephalis cylindrospora TaxID=1907219 RepID=A0A4V1IXT0_9FUNG|nr:hypothetical protein BJ684DRAFT_17353 [Piptocephalis cylindrospora]|eukprot:RKP12129.1 hypothetical protein BJ684DRAFT_17353 [Piptocephalis cylindrospora]
MDLSKDVNYNYLHPEETPCRWNANVRNCQDSGYYVALTIISVIMFCFPIVMGIMLIKLSGLGWEKFKKPSKWGPSVSFYIASIIAGIFFIGFGLVLLIDPPMPYWSRFLIADLPSVTLILGMIPYLRSLTTPTEMGTPSMNASVRTFKYLRVSIHTIPVFVVIHYSFWILRGVFIDKQNPPSIATVEEGMAKANSFGASGTSRSASGAGLSYKTRKETSNDHSLFSRLFSPASSTSVLHQRPSEDRSKTMTTIEAWAALRKITLLNLVLAGSDLMAAGFCLITGVLPSSLFTIPVLSKIFFYIYMVTIPFKVSVIMACGLYAEWVRRRDKEVFASSSKDSSLVARAVEARQSVLKRPTESVTMVESGMSMRNEKVDNIGMTDVEMTERPAAF